METFWRTLKELIFAGTNFRGRKKIWKIAFRGNLFSRFSLFRIFRGIYFSRLDQILKWRERCFCSSFTQSSFKTVKFKAKWKRWWPRWNLSRKSVELSNSFQFLNFESIFFNFFAGINFRGFELGNIFAGSNFRDFAEKPRKKRILVPAKISSFKVIYKEISMYGHDEKLKVYHYFVKMHYLPSVSKALKAFQFYSFNFQW